MRSVQDDLKFKDDFAVYGENVASRMRGANQSSRAISIAKNRIDNILFQLEMGEFAHNRDATHQSTTYYSWQASPTSSSVSIPLSSPSPHPSSLPSPSTHSFHIPWQSDSLSAVPETQHQQPQQHLNVQQSQSTLLAECSEFLLPKNISH